MYLVVLRNQMDDLPIRLCQTLPQALVVAKRTKDTGGQIARRRLGLADKLDDMIPVALGVWIYEFDEAGCFAKATLAKQFNHRLRPVHRSNP